MFIVDVNLISDATTQNSYTILAHLDLKQCFALFTIFLIISFLITYSYLTILSNSLNKLIVNSTEIARGNFNSNKITTGNKYLDRIQKMFTYMADEMKRIKNIDLSGIINSKNKIEAILRNIVDGVIVTDTQYRILMVNIVAESLFGFTEEKASNKNLKDLIKNKQILNLFKQVRDGKQTDNVTFDFRTKNISTKKYLQASASRIYSEDNEFIGIVSVIRDITKEYVADKMKSELVTMVAHELKSPLTSIYGFSDLLRDLKVRNTKVKDYSNIILNETSRLVKLVNKFLDLSKLEEGKIQIQIHPFNIEQLIDKIITSYMSTAQQKNMQIGKIFSTEICLAYGDQQLIEQVVQNLLSNAIKYSPAGSDINIKLQQKENIITVSVIDNGYGIPEDAIDKIFRKFYRVNKADEESEGSSGLGLALTKEILDQHNSQLSVKSKLGKGSVFSFTLQCAV
ncbi:MAG: ATP-binding protein [bacterium]